MELGGFNRYIVSECVNVDGIIQNVPNDITIQQGGTVYGLLAELRDILPSYQIYFDIDGVFHYDLIPSGANEQITLDDDLIREVLVSESINTDFSTVKNYIEVYGRSHDVQFYASEYNVSGFNIVLTISGVTSYLDGMVVGFTTKEELNEPELSVAIRGFDSRPLVDEAGNNVTHLDGDVYYAISMNKDGKWAFLGEQQAKGIAYDDNPQSPFYINGPVGIIRYVCYGGEYDNIQSSELAQQRAEYELYLRDRLQDTISLYIIPIPWLDVNVLIRHIAKDDTVAKTYMIQSISYSVGGNETMSIVANQYYPLYNE